MTAITAVTAQNTPGVHRGRGAVARAGRRADRRLPVRHRRRRGEDRHARLAGDRRTSSPTGSKAWRAGRVRSGHGRDQRRGAGRRGDRSRAFERLMRLATADHAQRARTGGAGRARAAMAARGVAYLAKGGDAEGAASRTCWSGPRRATTRVWRSRAHRHPPHPRHRLHAVERDRHAARQGPAARAGDRRGPRFRPRGARSPRPASAPATARWATTRCASAPASLRSMLVELGDAAPGLFGRLAPGDQLEVRGRDHAFARQRAEIDHPGPELLAEQQHRDRLHLAGLDQRQQLEHLVERAEPAREHRHRPRAHQEVHLAQREVVELERQVRRDIGIGRLLVRQHDVEPDRFRRRRPTRRGWPPP